MALAVTVVVVPMSPNGALRYAKRRCYELTRMAAGLHFIHALAVGSSQRARLPASFTFALASRNATGLRQDVFVTDRQSVRVVDF